MVHARGWYWRWNWLQVGLRHQPYKPGAVAEPERPIAILQGRVDIAEQRTLIGGVVSDVTAGRIEPINPTPRAQIDAAPSIFSYCFDIIAR